MKSKRKTKKIIRSLIFFGTISVIIVGYFIYLCFYYSYNIYDLNEKQKKLSNELVDLEVSEKYFRSDIDKLKDSEYIAKYARETYLYSKSGEIIIKLNEDDETQEVITNNKYIKYIKYTTVILFIIIMYIVIKNKKHKNKHNKKNNYKK